MKSVLFKTYEYVFYVGSYTNYDDKFKHNFTILYHVNCNYLAKIVFSCS